MPYGFEADKDLIDRYIARGVGKGTYAETRNYATLTATKVAIISFSYKV